MKRYAILILTISICLSGTPLSGIAPLTTASEPGDLLLIDSIVIQNNADFTSENGVSSGSGTKDDPYIIENYRIGRDGVQIYRTDAYFIVRHNQFNKSGIRLEKVTHALVENNTFLNSIYDIYLQNANYNIFKNNIQISYVGETNIFLSGSNHNIIENNLIAGSPKWRDIQNESIPDTGIKLIDDCGELSNFNVINNNIIKNHTYQGIGIGYYHRNNIIYDNIIMNNNVGILNDGQLTEISLNIIKNCNEGIMNGWGKIIVTGNIITENEIGMFTRGAGGKQNGEENVNEISCNVFSNNTFDGIQVNKPGYEISNNTISDNGRDGIWVNHDSPDEFGAALIHSNLICRNMGNGIKVFNWNEGLNTNRPNVTIYGNSFIDNHNKPQCEGKLNSTWNISEYGNYWSDFTLPDENDDGIVDIPYLVNVSANISDRKPVTEPFIFNNQIYMRLKILGEDVRSWNSGKEYTNEYAVNIPGAYHWSLDTNASWLKIEGSRIYGTPSEENVGIYWVNLSVTDGSLSSYRNFTLRIIKSDPPQPDLSIIGEDIETWIVGDYYSSEYSTNLPGAFYWGLFTDASWMKINGSKIYGLAEDGDEGTYWVNVSVSDGSRFAFRNFTLTIGERPVEGWNELTNKAPSSAEIKKPVDPVKEGESIVLSAIALDPDIASGDCLRYEWFITRLGFVGSGEEIILHLNPGTYNITLKVIDYYNRSIEVSNEVVVLAAERIERHNLVPILIAFVSITVACLALLVYRVRSIGRKREVLKGPNSGLVSPEEIDGDPLYRGSFPVDSGIRAGSLGPSIGPKNELNLIDLQEIPFHGIRDDRVERTDELKKLLQKRKDRFDGKTYRALRRILYEE